MPKYLFYGSYTPENLRGLMAEGGSSRIEAAKQGLGNVSGTFAIKTVVLLTPEEVDEAEKKAVNFRPPGHKKICFPTSLGGRWS